MTPPARPIALTGPSMPGRCRWPRRGIALPSNSLLAVRLDSVRDLKAALLARPRHAGAVRGPGAGVALGIHPDADGEFRLAVSTQEPGAEVRSYVEAAAGEVDVRHIGLVRAFENTARVRPLRSGWSIGEIDVTAGTLGCFLSVGAEARILSNNHVLANEDRARPGAVIVQPGVADGGHNPDDRVGVLDRAVALSDELPNRVDVAIATVEVEYDAATIAGLGELSGETLAPEDAGSVAKLGRTTELTRGTVTAFELDGVTVQYDRGALRFDDQVDVHGSGGPFSQGGDSGSLIVSDPRLDAVALLFAGNDEGVTYGNPIAAVLDALGATLMT